MRHLIVLLHGRNGFNTDMDLLKQKMEVSVKNIHVFVPQCNQARTHDGIESGAERLLGCVLERIKRISATHISFICHHLGT